MKLYLTLPLLAAAATVAQAGVSEAVRLFVERARMLARSFSLTENNAGAITDICRKLDGIPLGIELAASWVSVLSCAEIADEIEGNIDFLATSGGGHTDE